MLGSCRGQASLNTHGWTFKGKDFMQHDFGLTVIYQYINPVKLHKGGNFSHSQTIFSSSAFWAFSNRCLFHISVSFSFHSCSLWNLLAHSGETRANTSRALLLTPSEKWISIVSESFSPAVDISDVHGEITEWITAVLRTCTAIWSLLNMKDSDLRRRLGLVLKDQRCHYCGVFNTRRRCPSAARRPWESVGGVNNTWLWNGSWKGLTSENWLYRGWKKSCNSHREGDMCSKL